MVIAVAVNAADFGVAADGECSRIVGSARRAAVNVAYNRAAGDVDGDSAVDFVATLDVPFYRTTGDVDGDVAGERTILATTKNIAVYRAALYRNSGTPVCFWRPPPQSWFTVPPVIVILVSPVSSVSPLPPKML